jgi:ubiquinone/menaquinone biosynthesis C-methylase UbiE
MLQERVFTALYGHGAVIYDRFTDWLFLGEWQRWQETVLPELPEVGLVVELGAGTGRFAERAASADRRWIAIDRSPSMLAVAARRADKASYVLASAHAIPLVSECAEAVVATFPTLYIVDPTVATEIRRILRPDGKVIVVLSGELAPDDWRRRWRWRALTLFYGKRNPTSESSLTGLGLHGETERRQTAHGWADLYMGYPRRPRGDG